MLSYLKGTLHMPLILYPVGRLANTLTVVGGRSVRCAQRLLGAYRGRGGDELRPGNGPELLLET